MKNLKNLKIGVIFSLLFFLSQNLFAGNFILSDDNLIDPRAKSKINEIGSEVKSKLGTNVYIYAKESLDLNEDTSRKEKFDIIKNLEKEIIPALEKPYILLSMSVEDMYVNLLFSDNLEEVVDKDDILNGYVIPLLASKDKNTLLAKVSASMLNGYSAIVDSLSENKEIKIESNAEIGNQGKVSSTIWRVFMYTLIVTSLILYTYAVLRKKK
ncbi:hypothetical protein [Poseidonibacter lekithochrous]|uniref:hypothetical protein n=1 Tax=Poseidonibacter lekithochrous TaxID=1904463 RepID=UPI0008FC5707|nr:hypothetical protein [Poseidonibacter lekithochrous]QKJ21721.1 putative membrane protein [Poseidonibacter lekithochrous]